MKKFISPYGWFSIQYPENWYEFEDEEGSFLFYNPNKWTGNLRVSAFKDESKNYAKQMLSDELKNYSSAVVREINGWTVVSSSEDFEEEGRSYTCYTYLTGKGNTVVEFSFTSSKGIAPKEAEIVIGTLEIRDEKKHYQKEVIPVRVWEIHQVDEAFDWVCKTIKKSQKKDFTGEFADISKLQQLIDSGIFPPGQRETWEAIGISFGVILTNEMDGMEWVSVIDGKREYPALKFQDVDFYMEPMKLISDKMRMGLPCNLIDEFIAVKSEIEAKL